jgi:DNA-binding CsgD family transcriptional regulator
MNDRRLPSAGPGQREPIPGSGLRGRGRERAALDQLVASVRTGHSQVLVVRGEAGVGKTALLDYLRRQASGCRVARTAGVESEMELAFAGLHQLCAPFLSRLEALPAPQRDALATAFALQDGRAPDRLVVGLAVLSLLAEAAREQPLICGLDDTQWLDLASVQALAFVARRLGAGPVGLVFAVRADGLAQDLTGLPQLVIGGLADGDARALLTSAVAGPLDERVRDRIVAETRGNPLALLELPRGLTPAELAGGFGLPGTQPGTQPGLLSGRIEESFRRRAGGLPGQARLLLLVAAAEPTGDPALVWRAAGRLGIRAAAADDAQSAGLLAIGGRVVFRHPLVRSAVYRTASVGDRRRVHAALAAATDPGLDPDRRAWHHAHAASGPDEDVAAELERSAGRAQARGGLAAAAAFLERSAQLTIDPARRARRALAAAQAKYQAGAPDAALALLAAAEAEPLGELQSARLDLLRGQIAFAWGDGGAAPGLLVTAARRLDQLDPALARETYRDAFYAALTAGRLAVPGGMRYVAEAVRAAPPAPPPAGPGDLLLDGLARLTTEGYPAGAAMLTRALSRFREAGAVTELLGWLPLACRMSHDVWDDQSWHALSTRLIALVRRVGALTVLPVALLLGVAIQLFAGDLAEAESMAREAEAVARATGNPAQPYGRLAIAAWTGRDTELAELIEAATPELVARGEGQWLTAAGWATALLNNGRGRYSAALAAAEKGCEYAEELGLATWSTVELIEAAARTGQAQRAASAVKRLSETTRAGGTDWALGVEARSRALLSEGEPAERLYREAIERLGRTRLRAELARSHLVYGEWLRRQGRRTHARDQLRAAHQLLTASGMAGFTERSGRELQATGDSTFGRETEIPGELTAQEAQIARLARDGRTNPEIGAQLFISGRTVEWHLRKVFAKLGISSRRQLRDALTDAERPLSA